MNEVDQNNDTCMKMEIMLEANKATSRPESENITDGPVNQPCEAVLWTRYDGKHGCPTLDNIRSATRRATTALTPLNSKDD